MIHLIYGKDIKGKNLFVKDFCKNIAPINISPMKLSRELLNSYASQSSLFNEKQIVVLEESLSVSDVVFDNELLEKLKDSETEFIFNEDALTVVELKKYKKYFKTVEHLDLKEEKKEKTNPFVVANSYGRKDKIATWTSYIALMETGESPEAVAGMLFWKIKSLLSGYSQKPFTKDELKNASTKLVDLYHKSHRGECDMDVALEHFILNTL